MNKLMGLSMQVLFYLTENKVNKIQVADKKKDEK